MRLNRGGWVLGVLVMTAASVRGVQFEPVALNPVPIQSVSIDDPFWSPKFETWRRVTFKDCLDKFERDGVMSNFDHVARGEMDTKHGGLPWFDGLTYEMIRAAADFLLASPDGELEARLDGWIDRIAAAGARDPNGFLNTYTQRKEPDHRWGQNGGNDRWQHDLYNHGCLIEAAVHYYRATGKTTLLVTAVRAANGMCDTMGPPPRQNIVPGHALPEESMVELHRLFKSEPALKHRLGVPVHEADYLELAKFWIDTRGNHDGRTDFGAYNQDAVPGLKQETIEGHAVRAALFNSAMIALGRASGDPEYVEVAAKLWQNMVERRMYVTGGIGSFADDEKFGPDYTLPNNGYLETCAAVASCFFSHQLNQAQGHAAAVDELERALYNNALAGVSISGDRYFYENPLEFSPKRERWSWHDCPCCPPMFLKLMGALPGYIYATDAQRGVYLNLFIGSKASLEVDATKVSIEQSSRYPWKGDIRVSVSPVSPVAFDLYVRIPGWSRGEVSTGGLYSAEASSEPVMVRVNGHAIASQETVRGYLKLSREWKQGDVVEVTLPMPVMRVKADDRVESTRGRIALMRGPLVYCVESVDNGVGVKAMTLSADVVTTFDRPVLLGGVVALKAKAIGGAEMLAIPYFVNANRGPVEMSTWIPQSASGTTP